MTSHQTNVCVVDLINYEKIVGCLFVIFYFACPSRVGSNVSSLQYGLFFWKIHNKLYGSFPA